VRNVQALDVLLRRPVIRVAGERFAASPSSLQLRISICMQKVMQLISCRRMDPFDVKPVDWLGEHAPSTCQSNDEDLLQSRYFPKTFLTDCYSPGYSRRPGAVNRRSLSSILTWDSRDHDQEGHNDLGISQSSPYSNEGNAIAEDTVSDNGQIPDFASSYLHQPRIVQTPQSPARISSMGVADYQPLLSTDCICSRQSFDSIMRDYLQLIYPLVPVVHLPTFLKDLENHREQSDPTFLVFLAAICVLVVANIPKRFHEYRIMDEFFPFQSRLEMINFCYQLALQHRKVDYLDHSSHMKWATSYMLSIGYHSIRLTNRGNILFMECNHHLRMLGCLRASSFEGLSCIETQLRKKALLLSLTADL
jgi:hypothetical protein